jgi:hypothetical protein
VRRRWLLLRARQRYQQEQGKKMIQ